MATSSLRPANAEAIHVQRPAPAAFSGKLPLGVRLLAASLAALVGFTLLAAVGFANAQAIHEATHDARHAAGFPCH